MLVRRYQNQGITLPSRGSSPSEPNTPSDLSPYSQDHDYLSYNEDEYGNLMPPQAQGSSAGRHRSWSGFDNDSMSAWSSSGDYDLPMTLPTADMIHATSAIPDYVYAAPQTLGSNVSNASNQWTWTTTAMDMPAPLHAQSPISYNIPPQSAPAHYDDYNMTRPVTSTSRPYSRSLGQATYSAMPNAATTASVPRARTWSENPHYDSLASTTYTDPRQQQNPSYRF